MIISYWMITLRQESQLTPSCRDIFVPKYLEEKILGKSELTFWEKKNSFFWLSLHVTKQFFQLDIGSNIGIVRSGGHVTTASCPPTASTSRGCDTIFKSYFMNQKVWEFQLGGWRGLLLLTSSVCCSSCHQPFCEQCDQELWFTQNVKKSPNFLKPWISTLKPKLKQVLTNWNNINIDSFIFL